jgi:hypothetical protein
VYDFTGMIKVPYPTTFILLAAIVLIAAFPVSAQDDESGEYWEQIEREFGVVDDPVINGRVEGIEQNLLAVIPEAETDEREVVVKVLDEENVNAFALPDGHVYLFKGIVEACETDDMLAGVMAHELTHVFHRHHSRMGERQIRGMLIGIGAMIASGEGEALMLGQMLAASMVETYGRNAENDADRTGTTWAVEAGYDPLGYLELMQILEQEAIHRPQYGGNYFTIHPDPQDRLANIRETLEELGYSVPDRIYRVHLPIHFYFPLDENERNRLDTWERALEARMEGPSDDDDSDGEESDDETEEVAPNMEIPPSLLREYNLRNDLFSEINAGEGVVYGVVAIDDRGVFYLAGDSADEVESRGNGIISRLGDKFLGGLRNYQVQSRTVDGQPALLADRRIIAYTTDADAALLNLSAEEVNEDRVEILKDILYRYFVNRRI